MKTVNILSHSHPRSYSQRISHVSILALFVTLFATGCQVANSGGRYTSTESISHWYEYTGPDVLEHVSDEQLDQLLAEATEAYRDERRWALFLEHSVSLVDSPPASEQTLPTLPVRERPEDIPHYLYVMQAKNLYKVADSVVLWLEHAATFEEWIEYATDDDRWKGKAWDDEEILRATMKQLGSQRIQNRFFKEISLERATERWGDIFRMRRILARSILQGVYQDPDITDDQLDSMYKPNSKYTRR